MVEELITLRDAAPEDMPFLARLYSDTRCQEVSAWGWPPSQQELFLQMQFDAQHRSYRSSFPDAADRIIYVEDAPAGRLLVDRETTACLLVDIALLAAHRNHGIGTLLLRDLQEECRTRDRVLRLQVLRGNPAIRLYERLGFRQTGADPVYIQMEWADSSRAEKRSQSHPLRIQDFTAHLHTGFLIAHSDGYELRLVEVNDFSRAQQEQFSLVFAGPASPWLQQGTYTLIHPQLFELALFLVPIGPGKDGMRYEAVFSRLINT